MSQKFPPSSKLLNYVRQSKKFIESTHFFTFFSQKGRIRRIGNCSIPNYLVYVLNNTAISQS